MEIESNFTANRTDQYEPSLRYYNAGSRPQRRRVLVWFAVIFFFLNLSLHAQEAQAEAAEETAAVEKESEEEPEEVVSLLSLSERRRTDMEIRTSTLSELALWCRTLGLSESGTREDLSKRIRDHFKMPEPSDRSASNRKSITIESAQITEYFSIGVIDEDYARLKGNVRISLRDGDDTHVIIAEEILFNRTRNIITARGNVTYEKNSADNIETFRGANITVNLDDWSSVFLDGSSEKKLDSDGTSYLFSGEVISRSGEDVTILSRARISSANNEEALWSIDASRLWLLPGSDFAIFNALLKVGEIPVLYLPFFYFPADELVFHPVLGYRSREGGFIQTTTYIFGQPKANPADTSSLSRIMGNSDDKQKELHGLFLRNTGKKIINPEALSLKALVDYYVNLGAFIGLEFQMPKTGMLNPLVFEIGIGFSRTITQNGSSYTPYAPNYDGSFDWNHSNFISFSVPFRYRIKLNSSISGKYGSFSWDIPYYSDPYVDKDFKTRQESMDFFNMIQQGVTTEETVTINEIQTYNWHLSGNLTPTVNFLAPFITRASISNIFTTLSFRSIEDHVITANNRYDPGRLFYAPEKLTIYSITASISGTPLTIGGTTQKPENKTSAETNNIFEGIGAPISPWTGNEKEEENSDTAASVELLIPPVYKHNITLPGAKNARFIIDYQLTPMSTTELQFMSGYGRWKTFDQVDWSEVQSILTTFRGRANLNLRLDHTGGFFTNLVTFTGDGAWQDFIFLNEDAEAYLTPQAPGGVKDPARVETARRIPYSQTNYHTTYAYSGTVRPFSNDPIFGQTSLQYGFRGTLIKSKRYDPLASPNGPELAPQWGKWVKEKSGEDILGLTNHQLSANLAANILNKNQNITVSAALPPLDGLVSTNATFRVWISETNINFRVEKPEISDEWIFKPISLSEILRFNNSSSLTYYMVIDPEKNNDITSIRTTLTLWAFKAEFLMTHTSPWVFTPPSQINIGGWAQQGDPALYPGELSFAYNPSLANFIIVKDKINLRVNFNTSLKFNLLKYTESSFDISLGFTLNIEKFLSLEFSAKSTNNVIWRYLKGVPGMEDLTSMYPDGPQNNLFLDLLDSFNFFDESKRRRSGFKMGNLNIKVTHFLGDWKAELGIGMYPHRNDNVVPKRFEIVTDVSFLVSWTPISEIKSEFIHTGKTGKWEIK